MDIQTPASASLADRIAAQGPCAPGALLALIDLDDFHILNAHHGLETGDLVMLHLEDRLREALRDGEWLWRNGPDSFLLGVPDGRDTPDRLGASLCALVEAPLELAGQVFHLRASVGLAVAWVRDRTFASLYSRTELAQREARREGGGRYRYLDEARLVAARREAELCGQLRAALREEQLVLHYQPQIDCQTGEVCGYEALVRWQHPTRGLLGPDKFIPVAERLGLMVGLGQWVLGRAIADARALLAEKHATLAVNLSPSQLRDRQLVGFIQRTLQRHGLEASRLELEITESCLLDDEALVREQLAGLRRLGVRLALDDFGTGFCNLGYLQTLPVDRVKVDRCFLSGTGEDAHALALFRAMMAMLQHLSVEVLCEGVEQETQMRLLQSLRCNQWQGYFAARPMPLDAVVPWRGQARRWFPQPACADHPDAPTLLLVDDEPAVHGALRRVLRGRGWNVLCAGNAEEAFALLASQPVQVIISDHAMPGITGVELLSRARQLYPACRRILLTGHNDAQTLMQAISQSAVCRFISKPWNDAHLVQAVELALQ